MNDDAREFVRIGRSLEFEIRTESGMVSCRIEDIGEGGTFVDTLNPLGVGEKVDFRLSLDDGQPPIEGRAVVRWQQPAVGMGLQFRDLGPEARERIKFYVAAQFFRTFTEE